VVFPFWVPVAAKELSGSDVKAATVVGFPYGANGRAVKAYEARAAVTNGAHEIDAVMNIAALKSGEIGILEHEIRELVETTRSGWDDGGMPQNPDQDHHRDLLPDRRRKAHRLRGHPGRRR